MMATPSRSGSKERDVHRLPDREDDRVRRKDRSFAGVEAGGEPPLVVEHREDFLEDHLADTPLRVERDLQRRHPVVPADPLLFPFVDLHGIGRHLLERLDAAEGYVAHPLLPQRRPGDVDLFVPNRRAGDVERDRPASDHHDLPASER